MHGHLTGGAEKVPLTGQFVAKRQPGGLAGLPGTAVRKVVPLMGGQLGKFADSWVGNKAANELDSWEVLSQFKLEFNDTKLEFDARNSSIGKVSGNRSGRALISPEVHCRELLEIIRRFTWQTQELIDALTEQVNADRVRGEPAEQLSRYWRIAILWLGIGQTQKAFDAIGSGKQVISGGPARAEIGKDLNEIGRELIARLETTGLQRKASGIEDMLGRAGPG